MRGKFSPSNYCFIAARLKFNYLHLVMLLPLNNREQTQLLDGHLVSVIRRHFLPWLLLLTFSSVLRSVESIQWRRITWFWRESTQLTFPKPSQETLNCSLRNFAGLWHPHG